MARFVLEHKTALLQHLIDLSGTWEAHDIHGLFRHAERSFRAAQGTTWAGKDFWHKLEHEEQLWERERADGQRRRGHELGSEYDRLMGRWTAIWSRMTAAEWQHKYEHGQCRWSDIPRVFREGAGPDGYRVYEYTAAKLQQVVDAAAARARHVGKPDLAAAVQQVHADSFADPELRRLLEMILTQSASARDNDRFQHFVRAAKKKIKARAAHAHTPTPTPPKRRAPMDPAPPEEIRYDPPGCACPNCRGGKEWQDSRPHASPPATDQSGEHPAGDGPEADVDADASTTAALDNSSPVDADASTAAPDNSSTVASSARPVSDGTSAAASSASSPLTHLTHDSHRAPSAPPDHAEEDWRGKPTAPPAAHMIGTPPETSAPAVARPADPPPSENADADARQPHADPFVTKILGDLQYEPAVQQLLQYDKPLPSQTHVRLLKARESALEVMRAILESTPAAKSDLGLFVEKLEEIEDLGRQEEAKASRPSSAARRSQRKVRASSRARKSVRSARDEDEEDGDYDHDGGNDNPSEDEADTKPARKRLRARSSTSQPETPYDRCHNRWPCPMAKQTGCTTLFSKAGHAVRHARTVHDGKKDVQCPDCGKLFARHDNMNQHRRGVHKSGKRRPKPPRSSTEEAEDADLDEARRAHKRRKVKRDTWHSDDHAEQSENETEAAQSTRDTSTLTEFTSDDEDGAKEAPVEEPLEMTSDQEARDAIEAVYGPMSPTEVGGDDDDLTIAAAPPDAHTADVDIGHPPPPSPPPPPPPPTPPPPGEGALEDPLQIISVATAAAVAQDPGIARLEAKIDSLLRRRAQNTPMIKDSTTAHDAPASSRGGSTRSPTEALASIAEILQSSAFDGQSPEVTQLLMRMARDAADATIYAGEAMRRAGELAKNVATVLEKMCHDAKQPQQQEFTVTATTSTSVTAKTTTTG